MALQVFIFSLSIWSLKLLPERCVSLPIFEKGNTEVPRHHITSHTARNLSQVVLTSKPKICDVQYGLDDFCPCHIHCLVSLAFYIMCDFPSSYTDN